MGMAESDDEPPMMAAPSVPDLPMPAPQSDNVESIEPPVPVATSSMPLLPDPDAPSDLASDPAFEPSDNKADEMMIEDVDAAAGQPSVSEMKSEMSSHNSSIDSMPAMPSPTASFGFEAPTPSGFAEYTTELNQDEEL
eukprot:TRINITY_DN145_c0_g1_i2.p1 TRINITY_DN145_c0_g1~~TRINITY_DN145_c0_g1_i2.p1  ORF type:complete len:138 (+),score=41.60 TRINITY_DN145_c0_g1_i2:184-597(+)